MGVNDRMFLSGSKENGNAIVTWFNSIGIGSSRKLL